MLFVCTKCGNEHSRFRNKRCTEPASWCKECHAAYMRANRPKHSQLSEEQRFKANARSQANVYQRRGTLIVKPCEQCGNINSQKHHDDYNQPLTVRWLCQACHQEFHNTQVVK